MLVELVKIDEYLEREEIVVSTLNRRFKNKSDEIFKLESETEKYVAKIVDASKTDLCVKQTQSATGLDGRVKPSREEIENKIKEIDAIIENGRKNSGRVKN